MLTLCSRIIFVTSLLRIAESSGFKSPSSFTVSTDNISLKDENYILENIHITQTKENIDFIPEGQRSRGELKLFIPDNIRLSGNYEIKYKNNIIAGFGLNYDRKESLFKTYSTKELKKEIDNDYIKIISVDNNLSSQSNQKLYDNDFKYWKLFIVLALFSNLLSPANFISFFLSLSQVFLQSFLSADWLSFLESFFHFSGSSFLSFIIHVPYKMVL